jgi:hypothetical protein
MFIGCGKSLFETVCRMDLEGIVIYKRLQDQYAGRSSASYAECSKMFGLNPLGALVS